ncbi:MAG: hypothetical protein LBS20_19535 [Prevotella sp.]|jgi:hypothetical protein|nr:hypothetical protein [Prevotella sp.]
MSAFTKLIRGYRNDNEKWKSVEEIITLRSSFLIDRLLAGLGINFDKALEILQEHNSSVSEYERKLKEVLVAGINNLVDFAAAEEYSALSELPDSMDGEAEIYKPEFMRHNLLYATQENKDILYAASIAAWWIPIAQDTLVTFMTQGDERVRAWHLSHEGISYLKRDFPSDLIPPIEWGCRCFLLTEGYGSVMASSGRKGNAPDINPIFKESLATGGCIFSDAHPYFQKQLPPEIEKIKNSIKQKFGIT